jgi:hypothetical protein
MKPEYQKEYEALGLPISNDHICALVESYLLSRSMKDAETMEFHCRAVNNYHALKSAVEELREAAKETLGAWHGGTMNDVRAAMTLMEETLKETEGLV